MAGRSDAARIVQDMGKTRDPTQVGMMTVTMVSASETNMHALDALDALDHLITNAEGRHIHQINRLRDLITRGESITKAMRALVEIEDEIVRLNNHWISLTPDP